MLLAHMHTRQQRPPWVLYVRMDNFFSNNIRLQQNLLQKNQILPRLLEVFQKQECTIIILVGNGLACPLEKFEDIFEDIGHVWDMSLKCPRTFSEKCLQPQNHLRTYVLSFQP